jgi:hypothetical protein
VGPDRIAPLTDGLMHASDDRALVLGLGLILAAHEAALAEGNAGAAEREEPAISTAA